MPKSQLPQGDVQRPDDVFRVVLRAPDNDALSRIIREYDLDVDHQHPRPGDRMIEIEAFVPIERAEALKAAGFDVEVHENLSERGRERQKEVGAGDRFEAGKTRPRGLGRLVRDEG